MSKPKPSVFLPLLERALEHEIGITVEVNNPKALRDELYKARDQAGNPALEEIIMFLPEGREEVFICRRSVELGA